MLSLLYAMISTTALPLLQPHDRQHVNKLTPASLPTYSIRCLFNVTRDPCEYHDLAAQMPEVVKSLRQRLKVRQEYVWHTSVL